MKLEQRSRLDDRGKHGNASWFHEQGDQPEDDAVKRGQVWRPSPGPIPDLQLMFEQQRLRHERTDATRPAQARERDEQMNLRGRLARAWTQTYHAGPSAQGCTTWATPR